MLCNFFIQRRCIHFGEDRKIKTAKTLVPPTVIGFPTAVIDEFDGLMGRAIGFSKATIALSDALYYDADTFNELMRVVLENLTAAQQLIDDVHAKSWRQEGAAAKTRVNAPAAAGGGQ